MADVVAELYALPLEEFVAARDAAAAQARRDGDRVSATRIKALTKPTVAAWVVNQAARALPDAVAGLSGLGDRLRDATAARDRDAVRALDGERRAALDALVREVEALPGVGDRVRSADVARTVRDTFAATVADPGAAAAVRAGTLVRGLQHVGFGLVDESGEPAEVGARVLSFEDERRARRGERADDDQDETGTAEGGDDAGAGAADRLAAAEDAVRAAEADVDEAEGDLDAVRADQRTARDAVRRRRRALERLDEELARLQADRDAAADGLADAERAEREADEAVEAAEGRLDAAETRGEEARRRRREARAARRASR